ncbi:MAG: hypothetical protein LC772_02510, partial [Chloroflexi bacterium]|nr:hypothetical protein [Chloroflexota bacterium]
DPTKGTAYQLSQLLSLLSNQGAYLVRWNPTTQSYDTFTSGVPDSFLNTAVPGESYWVYLPANGGTAPQQIQLGSPTTPPLPAPLLVGGATPGSSSTAALASVPIERGWNQIGDPYVYSIAYSDIQVQYGNTQISLPQAVAQGIIATPVLWYWVHNSGSSAGGQYKALLPGQNSELIPYQGYWIDSNFNGVTLVFNAPSIPGAQLVLTPPNGTGGDGGTIITR